MLVLKFIFEYLRYQVTVLLSFHIHCMFHCANLSHAAFDHNQCQFSIWRVGTESLILQDTLSAAASPASTQEQKPITIRFFSTVLRGVSQGLPLLCFPCGSPSAQLVEGNCHTIICSAYPWNPCPPRSCYLFTDGFHISYLAHLFIKYRQKDF